VINRREAIMSGIAAALSSSTAFAQSKDAITLGQIGLSFHEAAAAVVARVLGDYGQTVVFSTALHEEMFARMRLGEVDLLCAAWLPGSHGTYLAPFEGEVEKLTVLYEPYAFWGVPDYVPVDAVRTVEDLRKPDVVQQMTKVIQGIGPGAGISRFSREAVESYGLTEVGYEFRNGTQQDCEQAFTSAVAEKRWVVIPLWQPQQLNHSYRIRELVDPRGLFRGKDAATLIARKDRLAKIDPSARAALRRIHLGNDQVTYLDYLINRVKLSPGAAADQWFRENPTIVQGWRT
jgi:glycine betaine/proline transport system substrate-binding protein